MINRVRKQFLKNFFQMRESGSNHSSVNLSNWNKKLKFKGLEVKLSFLRLLR